MVPVNEVFHFPCCFMQWGRICHHGDCPCSRCCVLQLSREELSRFQNRRRASLNICPSLSYVPYYLYDRPPKWHLALHSRKWHNRIIHTMMMTLWWSSWKFGTRWIYQAGFISIKYWFPPYSWWSVDFNPLYKGYSMMSTNFDAW